MNSLRFELSPSSLDVGAREEKATFGQFSVVVNGTTASEGVALGNNELLRGPYVPGYHVADWLVRNWWRLAYEPSLDDDLENTTMGWDLAHRMSTIGEGFVWPNILLVSDGLRMTVTSAASQDPGARAFRYVGPDRTQVVDLNEYFVAAESFLRNILELTTFESSTLKPELNKSWDRLQTEIGDSKTSTWRRIEAMLGYDPDEANAKDIQSSINDMKRLGNDAVAELAADANTRHNRISRAKDVANAAKRAGFDGRIDDAISLETNANIQSWGKCDAWRIGVATAHEVRRNEDLNGHPIDNARLASMAGTSENVISTTSRSSDKLSFVIRGESGKFRIAMRSKWETGRRFDVARLVADRLFDNGIDDALLPATQAYTYRQKAQRAFAAELLVPFDALEDFLSGDRSEERRNEAADHFNVSTYVISGSIQNNLRLH